MQCVIKLKQNYKNEKQIKYKHWDILFSMNEGNILHLVFILLLQCHLSK